MRLKLKKIFYNASIYLIFVGHIPPYFSTKYINSLNFCFTIYKNTLKYLNNYFQWLLWIWVLISEKLITNIYQIYPNLCIEWSLQRKRCYRKSTDPV